MGQVLLYVIRCNLLQLVVVQYVVVRSTYRRTVVLVLRSSIERGDIYFNQNLNTKLSAILEYRRLLKHMGQTASSRDVILTGRHNVITVAIKIISRAHTEREGGG